MNRRLTTVAAAAATLVMGFIGVPTAAAEIEGPHFSVEAAPAAISGRQGTGTSTEGKQVFIIAEGSKFVCETAEASGNITEKEFASLRLTVNYRECSVFGFVEATISTAHYNINADGDALIEGPITISAPGCAVTLGEQAASSVSLKREGKGIDILFKLVGLKSTGSEEATCKAGDEGTYNGEIFIASEEGSDPLEWHEA